MRHDFFEDLQNGMKLRKSKGFLTVQMGKKIPPPFTFPTKFEEKNWPTKAIDPWDPEV